MESFEKDLIEILERNGFDSNDFIITEIRSGPRNVYSTVYLTYYIKRISIDKTIEYDNDWVSKFIDDLQSLKFGTS